MLGGGSRSALWCQIMADVLGREVKLVREQESTALGAGIHAAKAMGFYESLELAAEAMTGIEKQFSPDLAAHETYTKIFAAYCNLYPGLQKSFQKIAEVHL